MKKITEYWLLLLVAVVIGLSTVSCEDRVDKLSTDLAEEISSSIEAEFENLNTDSIGNNVIYVSPQVSVANSDDFPETVVAVTAIVFAIGLPFLLVFGVIWLLVRVIGSRQRARYKLIELSLKQGMPLPDSFYQSEITTQEAKLRSGIVWIGWGVTIVVFFMFVDTPVFAFGLLPIFVGLSRLAAYNVGRNKDSVQTPPEQNESQSQTPEQVCPPIPHDDAQQN